MRQFNIIDDPDWAARIVVRDDGQVVLYTSIGLYVSKMTLEEILAHPEIFKEF